MAWACPTAIGQFSEVRPAGGTPFRRPPPGAIVSPSPGQPGTSAGQQPGASPAEGEKKPEEKGKSDKGDNEKKEDGPVKRPDKPPRPPDPRELDAKPDADGRVRFAFNGQPWADVLQWLANISGLSLDWRELPPDYLNLSTQRSYSLAEARDLINRHLQARGYALLLSGEVLSVVKLDAVDPSLVPRVSEDELYDRQPHDLVKLSVDLPTGMDPKQAVEDVKQALGPHAKAMPLAASKRLLLIDTAVNLRMVTALLGDERLEAEGRVLPREFVLRHVQAASVIDTLYVVLGLDPNSRPSQMELQMQQQKLQLLQQMAGSGTDVSRLLQKDGPPVYLAYNRQRNSVLVNAPEAEMRVVERAIEALDVPSGDGPAGDTSAEPNDDPLAARSLRQYRLKTIEPQAVVGALEEIGDLGPRSELRADKESKTLFARASDADHAKIEDLIDKLDGAETVVEVFWLRRLPAEAVAGSIESLIIQKPVKKKKDDGYPFFFSFNRDNQDEEEPATLLRVDADIENNRLIARGTPQQLEEVRDLLAKLGEPVEGARDARRVRVLDTLDPEAARRLVDQLRRAWPAVGGGAELVAPPTTNKPGAPADAADPAGERPGEEASGDDDSADSAPAGRVTAAGSPFRLLSSPAKEEEPPPVSIEIDARGRVVIASDDTAALDRLEELAAELAPPAERYHVFVVANRDPEEIVSNLEVYFEDFLAEEDEQVLDWWGRVRGTNTTEDEPVRLSRRLPLRFLPDDWSSSILVANATTPQLREIERLIESWDRTPVNDRILTRRTATVKLRYAQASVVVSALKDVYRDLLSKGDREFDTQEQKAKGAATGYLTRLRHGSTGASEPTGIPFGGLLSLGSDDAANVVIVSARSEVFDSVLATIGDLDEQARPTTTVEVVSLGGGVASDEVRRALTRALAAENPGRDRGRQDGGGRDGEGRDDGARRSR